MAHELRNADKQQGRAMAWHGLTEVIPQLTLSSPELFLRNWDVEPLTATFRAKDGKMFKMTDDEGKKLVEWEALVVRPSAADIEAVAMGAAPSEGSGLLTAPLFVSTPYDTGTYTPLPNSKFLDIIAKTLEELGIGDAVASCGSVFDRRRVFVSIPLPGMEAETLGERVFENYLNLVNSFDMSCHFMANTSNICTVCNNTFTANLHAGGCMIKHTKNMFDRLDTLPDVIAEALTVQKQFANDFLILAGQEAKVADVENLFAGFLVGQGGLSTRSANTIKRLMELFAKGAGNKGETYADAFSAVTDYYSHESAGGESPMKQFQSSEFGSGANKKRDFMAVVIDNKARKAAIATGKDALKAYREKEAAE
jgi:hypothetical protein